MKPEEIAALRQLSEWLQEPACGEDMLASENVRKIVIAAKSVGPLLEHIDLQAEQITRLQKVISEPVESFGTPELLEWANGLQKIIADYPESERGELPFVMLMGSHLEKFAKSWNSPAMKRLEAERAVWIKHYQDNRKKHAALKKLGEMVRARGKALVEERARRICHQPRDKVGHWPRYEDLVVDEARAQLHAEGVIR